MKNYPAFRVKVGLMKKASADKMNQLDHPACKVVNIVFLSISFTICFGSQKNHLFEMVFVLSSVYMVIYTGPRSAVDNVSGYRCEADCRSRGREFDPGLVPFFRGD